MKQSNEAVSEDIQGFSMNVLVVDDSSANRVLIASLVRRLGHKCIEVHNGKQAVEFFAQRRPDMVLMDVSMPDMSGLEATRRIRRLAGPVWVPILLMSAFKEERDMVAGLEAGADDCLTKPINFAILSAKMRAAQRQLTMQRSLQRYHLEQEQESEFARMVMDRQLRKHMLDDPRVRCVSQPAERFSGDIVAAARYGSNRLYAMVADATGHGLAAAISTLPVLQVFYGMAQKGLPLSLLVKEANRHLCAVLPVGRFVAATLLALDLDACRGELWIGGMPETLHIDSNGTVVRRYVSANLPLGIDESVGDEAPEAISWDADGQLLLYSDGVVEAQASDGEQFGPRRLDQVIAGSTPVDRYQRILEALKRFRGGYPAHDDVSMMLIDLQ